MKIGVKNLRSLKDTGLLEIKDFTFLLGKNSSGKSTFLRTLPLLRQSIETNTKGPILWYGSYVDFGDFKTALNDTSIDNFITLSFLVNLNKNAINMGYKLKNTSLESIEDCLIELKLEQSENGFSTIITSLTLSFLSNKIVINFKNEKITKLLINDKKIPIDLKSFEVRKNYNSFLPLIENRIEKETLYKKLNDFNLSKDELINIFIYDNEIRNDKIKNFDSIWKNLDFNDIGSFNRQLKGVFNIKDDKTIEYIYTHVISRFLPNLIDTCDSQLKRQFRNFYYMAPLRAVAERYYRPQDLNIEEVDFEGRNLALVLANLEDNKNKSGSKQEFIKWCLEYFNFYPEATLSGGNISINICFNDGNNEQKHNITDLGFGFSQILPVITQIWLASNNRKYHIQRMGSELIFIIEQPELHLHPKMQGKLINALISIIEISKKKLNGSVKFLIETHSDTIINAIGNRIYAKKLKSEDINVYIFNRKDGISEIEMANYDTEGILGNWPYGFFDENFI